VEKEVVHCLHNLVQLIGKMRSCCCSEKDSQNSPAAYFFFSFFFLSAQSM